MPQTDPPTLTRGVSGRILTRAGVQPRHARHQGPPAMSRHRTTLIPSGFGATLEPMHEQRERPDALCPFRQSVPILHSLRPRRANARAQAGGWQARSVHAYRVQRRRRPAHRHRRTERGRRGGRRDQVLLGATGTGKTFTMAKVIEETQRPAIILAPTRRSPPSSMANSRASFPKTRSSISSATTTTTSPRPMSPARTPISRRKARSTNRSTGCATRPPGRCWNATT